MPEIEFPISIPTLKYPHKSAFLAPTFQRGNEPSDNLLF